jgi:hypothetical protein
VTGRDVQSVHTDIDLVGLAKALLDNQVTVAK